MKKQLLLLPLVALLAGCNTSGGSSSKSWDKFANIRNTKISEKTKQEIFSNYHGFTLKNTTSGKITTIDNSRRIDTFNQEYSLDLTISENKESGYLQLLVDSLVTPALTVSYNKNNDPQYQGGGYIDPDANVEEIYKYCEEQLFSWNINYYSGTCTGFSSDPGDQFTKTNFYKIFCGVIAIEGNVKKGTFDVVLTEQITVSEFDEYETTTYLRNFSMSYQDYHLVSFESDMQVGRKYETTRQVVDTKTTAEITYK